MNSTENLNENINANRDRFDDLMNTISEARKSLINWQDQKTEALIKLDALSYDIRMISEEKEKAREHATALRKEMENEVRIYQNHIDNLSDQIQMLQVEREGLQNQLNQSLIENQVNYKELTRLMESEFKLQEELNTGIARIQKETENRLSDEYRSQLKGLNDEIAALTLKNEVTQQQRKSAEANAERLERELHALRTQMMGVLRVADETATVVAKNNEGEEKIDAKKLRAVEMDSTGSVDEYLRRLGY